MRCRIQIEVWERVLCGTVLACGGLITHERSPTASRKVSLSKLILRGNWSDRLSSKTINQHSRISVLLLEFITVLTIVCRHSSKTIHILMGLPVPLRSILSLLFSLKRKGGGEICEHFVFTCLYMFTFSFLKHITRLYDLWCKDYVTEGYANALILNFLHSVK